MGNLGKAEISGFEGEFSYDIGAYFTWDFELKPYVSFVYLTKYKDKETGEDLKYTSDANVSFGITFSDFKGLSSNGIESDIQRSLKLIKSKGRSKRI